MILRTSKLGVNSETETETETETENLDFSSTYSDNLPKILAQLGISLLATSYHSQRLIVVRSQVGKLETKLKAFPRPMGLYADDNRITLGTLNQVIDFKKTKSGHRAIIDGEFDNYEALPSKLQDSELKELTQFRYELSEQVQSVKSADSLFVERASLSTGLINAHDIAWGTEGLWVVNSVFSCLCKLSPDYSFVAAWRPEFISELKPDNRCHLNGMAMLDGIPRYATAFSESDTAEGWRDEIGSHGVLIDVVENKIVKAGISMPHSPRCHLGKVYYCASGDGAIHVYDPEADTTRVLAELPGFTRGMTFFGDLMIVGTSTLRTSDGKMNFTGNERLLGENQCGIWLLDINNGKVISCLTFSGDVKQIYDIAIVTSSTAPEVLQSSDALSSFIFEFCQE
ncbi:TIGR03032 family protein [Pseudoalteromonas sp. MMG013]|uniref:TIGR03032 family protein n=1 Tax=Pseudoalteromonas sp. MMG013 TaxID=2822687 RepID=UPI001B394768|nr:TIGR03032 family protein [Pseudoalteromonas sp. MMG013]MBQ4864278.1 TIGR03032 family protein [Pseudoalteromonas sp. MMG013]